jgi:predicted nucleic acid-binding protein
VIFVDSNVPMYLVGVNRERVNDARRALDHFAGAREQLTTSSEVFQEILHRFVSIRRHEVIQPAFDALRAVVDAVLPVTELDVLTAKDIVLARPGLSARDGVHAAVMQHHGITRILTFDLRFDALPGITRLPSR